MEYTRYFVYVGDARIPYLDTACMVRVSVSSWLGYIVVDVIRYIFHFIQQV